LAFEEVNMEELASTVMATMTGLIKDKPIMLERNIPAGLPAVRADPIRIRQVLMNLLSNAAKFTDEGRIAVDISVQPRSSGGQEILVSVTDTGPGIGEEDQRKLFQAFSQVDDSPTRRTSGSGLGLSISQHLIQMHSGGIGVTSEIGQGSTFYFTLPLGDAAPREAPGAAGTILIIDDQPDSVAVFRGILEPEGFKVVEVNDAAGALKSLAQLRPDAIILDVGMGAGGGWQVLSTLKVGAGTKGIPVVVCSKLEEHEKAFGLGAADYLVKPVTGKDLVSALRRAGDLAKGANLP
jgi:CheY-like chemotaxis protein